jgi:LacI family transcriptional regulator
LQAAGIEPTAELMVATDSDRETACQFVCALLTLPNRPTALIAGSHVATLGALKALRDLNLRYPDDVSLVCFDNSQWTDVIQPSLTVVTKPIRALARAAVDMLLDSIGEVERRRKQSGSIDGLPHRETFLEAQLIVRESTRSALAHPHAG